MKKWILALLGTASLLTGNETYQYVKELPLDLHGWFGNQAQLDEIFEENSITSVIELGSWCGCSTVYFGEKVGPNGKVFAIDTWLGSPTESAHMKDPRLSRLFQTFLSNVKHLGLEEVIVPFRMRTDEAAVALEITADLIYIDGDHTFHQVYRDIVNWLPHLNEGGVLCGDDWLWPEVRRAIEKAANKHGYRIEANGNFWRYY